MSLANCHVLNCSTVAIKVIEGSTSYYYRTFYQSQYIHPQGAQYCYNIIIIMAIEPDEEVVFQTILYIRNLKLACLWYSKANKIINNELMHNNIIINFVYDQTCYKLIMPDIGKLNG